MFCITLEPNHYKFIKSLGYAPVGLGDKNFDDKWYTDKLGINISNKNKNYGLKKTQIIIQSIKNSIVTDF